MGILDIVAARRMARPRMGSKFMPTPRVCDNCGRRRKVIALYPQDYRDITSYYCKECAQNTLGYEVD